MYLLTKKQTATIAPLRQLSYLLKQYMPISKALVVIIKDIENAQLQEVFTGVAEKINQGKSIEDSFLSYPDYFPDFLISLLCLGSKTGNISTTLKHYTSYVETRLNFVNQIKTALIYPIILLIVFVISLFFLINFVFPQIINLFSDNLSHLPTISRLTISVLMFLDKYFLMLVFTFIFIAMLLVKAMLHYKVLDKIILKIPLLKNVVIKSELSLWLSLVETSLKSGNMFFDAFRYASQAITNTFLKQLFINLIESKESGGNAKIWNNTKYLPEFFKANIYNILENESFAKELVEDMYVFYQKDVTDKINIILKAIEPVLIILMGIIIGLVSISVLLPILDSTKIASF